MNKITNSTIYNIAHRVFVTLILVYAVLGSNNITYGKSIITPVMWITFFLGFVLLGMRVIDFKKYLKMTAIFPMVAMVFSIGISTLANRQYHFKENAIICIYWVLFFFLLYAIGEKTPMDKVKKDFEYLSIIYTLYITFGVIVSFIMMYKGVSEKISVPEAYYDFHKGFAIGRLWGMFINPNHSAISAAIVIGLLIYFMERYKNIILRIACGLNMIVMVIFIALTDSRTGAVCLGIVLGFYALGALIYRGQDRFGGSRIGKKIVYYIVSFAVCISVGIGGFVLPRKTKDWYNQITTTIANNKQEEYTANRREELLQEGVSEDEIDAILEEEIEKEDFSADTIDRGYDLTEDISNRRIAAWMSAVEVFVSSPKVFILGASFKGFSDYAIEHIPETYIVNNDYARFTTLDNEIFNIMDAQGIIGLLALVWLLVSLFVGLFKYFAMVSKEDRLIVIALTAIIFGLAASAMFVSVMFYHFSQNTILFWVALGTLMYLVKNSAGEDEDNSVVE